MSVGQLELPPSPREGYPDVQLEFMYVDNAAMQIIQKPSAFDVLVTENMFGDLMLCPGFSSRSSRTEVEQQDRPRTIRRGESPEHEV